MAKKLWEHRTPLKLLISERVLVEDYWVLPGKSSNKTERRGQVTTVARPRNQIYTIYQTLGRWYHYTTGLLRVYINATSTPHQKNRKRDADPLLPFLT